MKIIPFGDRILVKRRKIGEKIGSIILPDEVKERNTDLADVVYVPDLTFADKHIIDNQEAIVRAITERAKTGDSGALEALLGLNQFLKVKSIKTGDAVMVSKYVGVDFHDTEGKNLTLVSGSDVIGVIQND